MVGGYECREVDLRPAQWDGGVGSGQDWVLRYVWDKGGDWGGGYIYSDSVRGRGCRRRGVWGGGGYETVERGRGGGVVRCER